LFTSAGGSVANNATGTFTGLNAGDYYVVASNGACTAQSATLTISNASAPPAPVAGTDATYCDGDALNDLTAAAGSGGTLTWYDDAGLTNNVGTGTTLSPTNTTGATIYYVTETLAGCESPATAITITINAIPTAPVAGTDATYCAGDAMTDLTVTAGSAGTLNWYSDAGLMTNIGTGTTLTPGTTIGATTYYVTESLGACVSPASTVVVTINDNPTITTEVATDLTDCITPNGTVTITSNGTNYELFTAAGVSVATNATGAFTGLGAGTYYVVVSNGTCSTTGMNLTIIDQTTTSTNTVNNTVCEGASYTYADGTLSSNITSNESHISTLTNAVGCDSVVTENITVTQSITVVVDTMVCSGTNYTFADASNHVNILIDQTHTSNLTSSSGCDSIVIENVTVIPPVDVDLGGDVNVCFGETITITANTNAGTPLWSTGDTTMSIDYSGTVDTFFVVTVTGTCGNDADTIFISVLPPPDVDAGPDVTIPLGVETQLEATSMDPGVTYVWSPDTYLDCSTCADPIAGPLGTITYLVTGTDENGCTNTDTITVIIDGEVGIYIPNIFSPNNDNQNDIFSVYGPSWRHYRMEIYNRWGGLIWLSEDPNMEWDGTHKNGEECPQAVFIYKFWGVSTIGMSFEKSGNVMLTR
jgi:gliding motility-associated-like protein